LFFLREKESKNFFFLISRSLSLVVIHRGITKHNKPNVPFSLTQLIPKAKISFNSIKKLIFFYLEVFSGGGGGYERVCVLAQSFALNFFILHFLKYRKINRVKENFLTQPLNEI
jgi:hypothetical protein